MELQDVINRRRMYRKYDPDRPVPEEALDRILYNGTRAPSAGFAQGLAFLVLTTPEERTLFWEATNPPGQAEATGSPQLYDAPAIIVPLAHKQAYLDRYAQPDKGFPANFEERWRVPHWYVDTAFGSMLMLLTVVDEELGALFFSIRDEKTIHNAFGVPEEYDPIGAITIGYPAAGSGTPNRSGERRDISDIVHRGRWNA